MLFIFLLACQPDTPQSMDSTPPEPVFWSPEQEGLFDAGLHSFSFESSHGRTLYVDVWYPAERRELDILAEYEPFSFRGKAYRDAPIAKRATSLIAFSHGLMSVRFQNAQLCEHLAQHGFTVIAPDHPGTSIFDLTTTVHAEDIFVRPDDIRHSVDHFLQKTDDANDFLFQLVIDPNYIAIGHSLGSHTVMALGGAEYDFEGFIQYCDQNPNERVCGLTQDVTEESVEQYGNVDSRVYATIPMSPGFWYTFGEGLRNLQNPFFVMGALDTVLNYETKHWQHFPISKRHLTTSFFPTQDIMDLQRCALSYLLLAKNV